MTDQTIFCDIAFDFDNVIHQYSQGWKDGQIYDPPMRHCEKVLDKLYKDYKLCIFTTRENLASVMSWLRKYNLDKYFKHVTNKKPVAKMYVDDRAVHFDDWLSFYAKFDEHMKLLYEK